MARQDFSLNFFLQSVTSTNSEQKMNHKTIITVLAAAFINFGCDKAYIPDPIPQIVVEGWIEANGYPVVILTSSVPIGKEVRENESINDYVINWGKVTISDGENDVVLIGKRDNDYFPPYIYTTSEMKGVAGKSYSIKVEYSGRTVTATTTIPDPVYLEYIKVKKSDKKDSYYLTGVLKDNTQTKDYYKSFVRRINKDSTYRPSFMGLINDDIISEKIVEIPINNGISTILEKEENFFSHDDVVLVKFCTMDEQSYLYWSDFDAIYSLSRNPFFPVSSKIRSNVIGGLGYWAGYGSTFKRVSIADSLALGKVY